MIRKVALTGSAALLVLGASPAFAQFKSALETADRTIQEGARSQQRIEELDEETSQLLGEFRAQQKQLELLQRYNVSRARQVEDQEEDKEGYRRDIANVEGIKRAVRPLMEDMVAQLEQIVEADTPFLLNERRERVARLQNVLTNSAQSEASVFGVIIEAFQIEEEYGRTVGVYEDEVDVDGEAISAQFLRIGRTALIYKTADDAILRIWDKDARQFVDLDRRFLADIRVAMRIADGKAAPDLLTIPVSAPTDASAQ